MYKYLFWDLDDTLIDFGKAEEVAIKTLFKKFNIGECSDEMLGEYVLINKKYWEMLERKEISKEVLLVERFIEFFSNHNIDTSIASEFNEAYQLELGNTIVYCDNSYELLTELNKNYKQFIVTNGTIKAQTKKIARSKFDLIVEEIVISELLGYSKPDKRIYEYILDKYHIDPKEVLIIGDSLTSDIQGGINSNIDTCFYNPKHLSHDNYEVTYEIDNLNKIMDILN